MSLAQAICVMALVAYQKVWFARDYYNTYSIQDAGRISSGAIQIILLACFITFINYFISISDKKGNHFSKFLYLGNVLLFFVTCHKFNSMNYQISITFCIFGLMNLLLLLCKPKWQLKEKTLYVTTEDKQRILEENKELKKNFKESYKNTTYIVLAVMATIIFGITMLTNASTELICQSNGRDTSVKQVKVVNDFINIRDRAGTNGSKIGKVYKDEIYDVYETVTSGNTFWYKIKTNTGVEGYIYSGKLNEMLELYD